MLKNGMAFPDFRLQDGDGATVTLEDLKGGRTIVYFYPKDDTPGCTAQACALSGALPDFAGARVFGVSPDSVESHRAFSGKHGLRFPLLSDPDHALAEACGVWDGHRTARTTFLVDENGIVLHVFEDVVPQGHEQEIMRWL